MRGFLTRTLGVDLGKADSPAGHRKAFLGFLKFLKANLSSQTSLRVDPAWASQTALLQGMAPVAVPALIAREEQLPETLAHVEALLGLKAQEYAPERPQAGVPLEEIYDAEMERRCRAAYGRDYLNFGFGDWRAGAAG